MNVVKRDTQKKTLKNRFKKDLVRRDASLGIRGNIGILPPNKAPRYQFTTEAKMLPTKQNPMGPPAGSPRSLKRKLLYNSSSAKAESSSGGHARPRILANDSCAADTSHGFATPKNRPSAIRYISSSSSKGGYSVNKSIRSTSTSVVEASVILAISEGRGMARGEIGMAALDLRHPHLVLCQFSDTLLYTHTMTKINYFNPVEIIIPHTFCEGTQPSQLYKLIKDHYPLVNLTTVQRRHFNDAAGRQQIQTLCAPQYSAVFLQVLQKFYALTAAAAVLKYVEYIQCIVFARESLKVEYHSSEDTMIIDVGTATQLELVQPLVPSAGPTCCLLGVLGPTYTIGGIRALRASILQPSCNQRFIEARLNAVQELIENDAGLMVGVQDIIKKLSEIDKILFLCMETPNTNIDKHGEAQLNQTLLLKTTMELVPKLVEALETVESERLRKIKMDFENGHYTEIFERIRKIIQEDAHLEKGAMGCLQRCFAVKPEINGLLDVARRTYSELIEDIQKIVEQLGETYDLPLRLNQNVMKGFHVVLPIAPKNRSSFKIDDLPEIFIQVNFNGVSVTMSTEELVVLDQQAKESLNEIQKMSNIVITELLKELRPFMSSLYKLCENVAELDILLALAQASSVGSYIRPEFNNYLEVKNSVHPLLDYNSQKLPIPNDIFASPEYNFTIITGPNMGGKSIYIKQIAIIQIMAQVGCFIPATNAVLRLSDRLFSRIGFNDSVELNASTYVIEMKEIQHILNGLTSTSLVIVDELCRGTCSEEGTGIAWAICEELLQSDAFTFFTTHIMYLTRLQDLYYNVVNLHTVVTEEITEHTNDIQRRLKYEHRIEPGVTKIEHYGIALAAQTNLPVETVNLARELAELIDKHETPKSLIATPENEEQILYKLYADINQEKRKNLNSKEKIKEIFNKFKIHNPHLSTKIKNQRSVLNSSVLSTASVSVESDKSNEIFANEDLEFLKTRITGTCKNNEPSSSEGSLYEIKNNSYIFSNENKSASAKLSTELLTTVPNKRNFIDPIENVTDNSSDMINASLDINYCYSPRLNKKGLRIENIVNEKTPNDLNHLDVINEYSNTALKMDDANTTEINMRNVIISQNDPSETVLEGFDSDTEEADAVTQIIHQFSSTSCDSIQDSNNTSVDEDLMQEALIDIRKDLEKNYNEAVITLTPPVEFRDDYT